MKHSSGFRRCSRSVCDLSSERFEASGLVMWRLKFAVSLRNKESGKGSRQASSPFLGFVILLFHFVFCYFWFTQ